MVEQGLVNVAKMITHTCTLDQSAEAFTKRDEQLGDAIHIMIDCENSWDGGIDSLCVACPANVKPTLIRWRAGDPANENNRAQPQLVFYH